jgi:phenylacetate-CoA ligase
MNLRSSLYFLIHQLVGIPIGRYYRQLMQDEYSNLPDGITRKQLIDVLSHCHRNVPYYSTRMDELGDSYLIDPVTYLAHFPILTKDTIRQNFEGMKSVDLAQRKWKYNTSGGSTGEPLRLIQDRDFIALTGAIQWLSFHWAGREIGEAAVRVWGSERDILQGSLGLKMKLLNHLTNDAWVNAFHLTPAIMRTFIGKINAHPPQLIIAYAQAIYELAQFAEQELIPIYPQKAILTSAGTLHDFMRKKMETVFQCNLFNRYGSREVGDIASECESHDGLHVFPRGCYVEIVDEDGHPLPKGMEGDILVTSLANKAMPLVRYAIGDRGILSEDETCACGRKGLKFEKISGRNVDAFKLVDGTLIDGEYFTHLLYFRDWVKKFQVIQKDYHTIVYKIVGTSPDGISKECEEIAQKTKTLMGADCMVRFDFVDHIPPTSSGKYRYTLSEVHLS